MPNRILKESICSSDTVDALTAEEERLFTRLITKCDDFGCFDARPAILRAECFPLKVDLVSLEVVASWTARLADVGLIRLYEVGGRPYLQMVTWARHQQQRANKPKFPLPPSAGPATGARSQPLTIDSKGEQIPSYPVPGIRKRERERSISLHQPVHEPGANGTAKKTDPSDREEDRWDADTAPPPDSEPCQTLLAGRVAAMDTALREFFFHGRPVNATQARDAHETAVALVEAGRVPTDIKRLRDKIHEAFPKHHTVHLYNLTRYAHLLDEPEPLTPGLPLPSEPEPHGPPASKEFVDKEISGLAAKLGIKR